MPECSRTARILDHSGVDLQQQNIPVYPGFFEPTPASRTRVPHLVAAPLQPGF